MSSKQLNIDINKIKKQSKLIIKLDGYWTSFTWYIWRGPIRFLDRLWNFWRFRKEIFNFRSWDYTYNFELFIKSLEFTADGISKREIITDHQETSSDINRFIFLYNKQVNDNYFEEAGGDYNRLLFATKPIPNTDMYELIEDKSENSYTIEQRNEIRKNADILRSKDFDEMIEVFKKFQEWWD